MASFVINPGGPGGYVIPKRRNATEEEKKKERHGAAAATAEDDAKSASSSRAVVDNKKDSTASRGTAVPPIRNPLNVWTGSLRFEDQTVESVDLYSPFRDSAKPNGFSASLDIKLLVTSADCQKYAPIAELFNARFHGTLLRRPHLFVCLPRSSPSSSSSSSSTSRTTPMQASYFYLTNTFSPLFARIYDKLKAKEIVAISALAGNAMLFLLPEGSLTERLGIPMHDKPVFHCIFLHPRPDIMDDLCRRGLLTTEQTPHEPSSADKFDGADEAVLALVDKYRRTCGLPTAKRSAPSPLNSLLSPGKPPPAGKPPTPYIPTPGGSAGYAPAALLKQQQRNASFGYHSNSSSSNQDDWQALLQPPPPPPPPMPSLSSVQTALSGGTPRGILSHASSAAAAAHKRDTLRSPGTEARRPKNQTLFKNALEQIRKINEESKSGSGTVPSATSVSDPFPSSSIPPLKTPSPLRPLISTISATSTEQQHLPAPPVPPNLPRDPRLLKHGNATAAAVVVVVDKPNQQQQVRCATIPVDARPNSVLSPPCDPRLKRISAEALPVSSPSVLPPLPKFKATVPVLNVRPVSSAAAVVVPPPPPSPPPNVSVFKQLVPSAASVSTTAPAPPNLGFKRAYGLVGMAFSGIDIPPPPPPPELAPPEEKKMMLQPDNTATTDQENVQQQQSVEPSMPCLHVVSDETIIDADVPMEIDDEDDDDNDDDDEDGDGVNDDDADRPYSPSQAIPPPPPPLQLKTNNEETNSKDEYLDEEEEDEITEEECVEEKLDETKQKVVGHRQKKWTKVKREENESKKEEQQKLMMEEGKNGDEHGLEKEKEDEGQENEGAEEDKVEQQREQQRQNSPVPSEATRKADEEKGIQQSSPISLVRSLIPSLSPKGPSSPRKERRGANNSSKVSAASSASLNASGFGFDFLNWNSPDSPAKDAQMTSSASSNSSSAFRADETFDVEQLLKQAEISVVTSGSSTRKEDAEEMEKEDNDLRILHQKSKEKALVTEGTENNASPVVVVSSPASTPQSPINNNNNASSHAIAGMPIPTIPSSPSTAVIKKPLIQNHQQHTSPPPLMAITVPPPSLHVPPPSLALTAVPPPPLIMPSQLAMAATTTNASVAGGAAAIQKHGGPQQQQMHTHSPTAAAVDRPIGSGILHRIQCEPTTIHPSYRMHRLDVPPPVLNIPPPFIVRPSASATTAASAAAAAADHNNKKMLMMNNPPCKAIVLLDPEMIMCCRIKLDQLRAVFVAASRNSVRILLHQMITDKLIEVGVKAKPYMTLLDEFVAAGAVERMEPHQCDKSGLVLRELLACSIEMAARERRNYGNPKLRVLFLSAMIGPKSDDATKLGNSQIELVNAGQFVEQFK